MHPMRSIQTVWYLFAAATLMLTGCKPEQPPNNAVAKAPPAALPVAATSESALPSATPEEAKKLLDAGEGYVYVDVRTVEEFTEGHVPGAMNIPVLTVNAATGDRVMNDSFLPLIEAQVPRDAKVIVGCRSGARSARAQKLMTEAGYKTVINLDGGFVGKTDAEGNVTMPGWSKLGYPTETGDGGEQSYAKLKAKGTP